MAKYCIYCGKQLEEGTECDCAQAQQGSQTAQPQQNQTAQAGAQPQQNQAGAQTQQTYVPPAPNPAVTALVDAFKSLLTIVNKPVESLRGFVKADNFIAALILIGAQALIAALFTLVVSASLELGEIVNLVAIFFETFGFSLLLTAVLFGVVFLMVVIFKGKTDAKTLLCVVAVRSVITIPFMVLGLLIGLANAGIGIGLFMVSELFALFYMYVAMRFACTLEESKLMFVLPIAMTIVVFVYVLIFQGIAKSIITDMLGSMMGGFSSLFD